MCSRLKSFLKINHILYDFQFWFRANHSTNLTLLEAIDNIYNRLDSKDYILGIRLDLQRAFDTANHEILLWKPQNPDSTGSSSRRRPAVKYIVYTSLSFF
jgi:hypothetical protein